MFVVAALAVFNLAFVYCLCAHVCFRHDNIKMLSTFITSITKQSHTRVLAVFNVQSEKINGNMCFNTDL